MMTASYPYEQLGLLYLGRELDPASGKTSPAPLLFKNKDLTTHGMIIGMTGSGKTGLGIGLIEEAIMDNVPSLIIDPKGDMANLLLTFPDLAPSDFLPWLDPAEAEKKGVSVEQLAADTAATWKKGLASWDQGPERIAALRGRMGVDIYTPGASVAPVSVLGSFAAPAPEAVADIDTVNGMVTTTVTSLLALINIAGDPLQSREHLLLSSIFLHHWRLGQDLTLEGLIGAIVSPPFAKIGVFPLETFYPQAQRMTLAMNFNTLLAGPTFAAWTQGPPLDIQRLLYGEDGKPRTTIYSLAHLGEGERMFFVTMLLNRTIGWLRRQEGSSSLKALLYMDEIFGYFPPTAEPPSKKPMLLLLKQARAYGLGVVLATQNPVDLDYKGLSNIGTWFVGRLQTKGDQDRVVSGIAGAGGGGTSEQEVRKLLAGLKGRQFVLHSAHLERPQLFETRWAMSFLKGPISLDDIKKFVSIGTRPEGGVTAPVGPPVAPAFTLAEASGTAPPLSPAIEQLYRLQNVVSDTPLLQPWLVALGSVRYYQGPRNIDQTEEVCLRLYLDEGLTRLVWAEAEVMDEGLGDCRPQAPVGCRYLPLPPVVAALKDVREPTKAFGDFLYRQRRLELSRIKGLAFESRPGESQGDFRVRFADHLRRQKDEAIDKLRQKYLTQQQGLEQKLERALARLDKETVDVQAKTADSLISIGAAVFGAFLGRKTLSASTLGKAATGVRSVGRVVKEKSDVKRVEEEVENVHSALATLSSELEAKAAELARAFAADGCEVETVSLAPRRSDIFNLRLALLWEMTA
jgi:Helicase HerA, central domain